MPSSIPNDPLHSSHMPEYVAEFLGTGFMVFAGLSAVVFNNSPELQLISEPFPRRLLTGLLFAGTGSLVALSPIGKLSGAHINPAVSIVFWLHGKMKLRDLIGYIIAQFLGGIAGAAMLAGVWRQYADAINDGATSVGAGYTSLEAFGGEVLMTGLMMFMILVFVSFEKLMRWTPCMAWILIALMVAFEAPLSGTSLNPARSLGPALISGSVDAYESLWIYFIAPCLGAIAGWGLFLFLKKEGVYLRTAKLYYTDKYRSVFHPDPSGPDHIPGASLSVATAAID